MSSVLSQDLETQVSEALKTATQSISAIHRLGRKVNSEVVISNFLTPETSSKKLPYENKKGRLYYFEQIRNGLDYALNQGFIPKEYASHFCGAPQEIQSLIRE